MRYAPPGSPETASPEGPLVTDDVGPYRILSQLGSGGMGDVFLAVDTRLNRRVALKALQQASGEEAAQRLQHEARAAARLNHPGIAALHDIVESAGRAFLVMEYVDGEPLSNVIASGPSTIERAVDIGVALADALEYAHLQGVIHRDVKPANVMVKPDGSVKLLDLGIARLRDTVTGTAEAPTPTTGMPQAGTPAYMAPERLLGGSAGVPADVYGLGVVLFETLTGRRPFTETDFLSLAVAMTTKSAPDVRTLRPDVPAALASLLASMMAREPTARPRSAGEVSAVLKSIRGVIQGTGTRIAHPLMRRRRVGVSVAGLIVCTVALAAVTWRIPSNPLRSRGAASRGPIAVLPAINPTGDEQLDAIGSGLTALIAGNLAAAPGITVVPPDANPSYKKAGRDLAEAARTLGAGYLVDLSIAPSPGGVHVAGKLVRDGKAAPVWTGSYDGDIVAVQRSLLENLTAAIERAGLFKGGLTDAQRARLKALPTTDSAALLAYSRGKMLMDRGTGASLDQAISAFSDAVLRDGQFMLAHTSLSGAYAGKYGATSDPKWIQLAAAAADRAVALDPSSAQGHLALARVYQASGRPADALRQARLATELAPYNDDAYRVLGRVLASSGKLEEARRALDRAIQLRPDSADNHFELGYTLYQAGRWADAIPPFMRVTELQPSSADGFIALGTLYHYTGDVERAIGNYEHALRLDGSAQAYANLGFAYYSAGRLNESLGMYQKALELDQSAPSAHRNIADVYARMGNRREAERYYLQAIDRAQAVLKVNPRDSRRIALLAVCEAEIGRLDAGLRHAAEAAALSPSDNEVIFKLASVYAIAGRPEEAVGQLRKAIELGYPPQFAADNDALKPLRGRKDFQDALNIGAK